MALKTGNVLYLASDPKAAMQPHEPVGHRFDGLPLALLQTEVCQLSAGWLSHMRTKRGHTVTFQRSKADTKNRRGQRTQTIKPFISKDKYSTITDMLVIDEMSFTRRKKPLMEC